MIGILVVTKKKLLRNGLIRWLLRLIIDRKLINKFKYYQKQESSWYVIQNEYLYDILSYARIHSRYYSDLIPQALDRTNCVEVLKKLPLLTKDIIRTKKDSVYSDEVKKKAHGWANTGGSTGEPLVFPTLPSSHPMEPICQLFLYKQMGVDGLNDIIVSIDGTRIAQEYVDMNIYWKRELFNFPYGQYSLSTLHMSDQTMPYYIKFLNQIKPKVIRGYPSGIMELAKYCKKKNISFEFQLKGIYLTSENFGLDEEMFVSDIFACPVWGQYGHTEASIFAIKKPHDDKYLCSPIYGYTEILSEDGVHVNEGEVGEIVVTGFNHYGLPFIRYKTGDLAEYGGTLENGSVILNKLLGRSIDYLINKKTEKIYLVGFIFGGHLKAFNHIKQWQLEQFVNGEVSMKIVKGLDYNNKIEAEIINLFASKSLNVSISYVGNIEKTGRGKVKFLIQHLN